MLSGPLTATQSAEGLAVASAYGLVHCRAAIPVRPPPGEDLAGAWQSVLDGDLVQETGGVIRTAHLGNEPAAFLDVEGGEQRVPFGLAEQSDRTLRAIRKAHPRAPRYSPNAHAALVLNPIRTGVNVTRLSCRGARHGVLRARRETTPRPTRDRLRGRGTRGRSFRKKLLLAAIA